MRNWLNKILDIIRDREVRKKMIGWSLNIKSLFVLIECCTKNSFQGNHLVEEMPTCSTSRFTEDKKKVMAFK